MSAAYLVVFTASPNGTLGSFGAGEPGELCRASATGDRAGLSLLASSSRSAAGRAPMAVTASSTLASPSASGSSRPDLPSECSSEKWSTTERRRVSELLSRPSVNEPSPGRCSSSTAAASASARSEARCRMRFSMMIPRVVARRERCLWSTLREMCPGCRTQHAAGATSAQRPASTSQSTRQPYATSRGPKSSGSSRPASE